MMLIMEDKNIKKMRKEEAVSSIISVILLVVIVVIIAAVLAIFAFGVGAPVKTPMTKLDYVSTTDVTSTSPSGNLCIRNSGGDSLLLSELMIKVKKAGNNGAIILPEQKMISWVNGGTKYLTPGVTLCGPIGNVTKGDLLSYQVTYIPTGQLVSDTSTTVNSGSNPGSLEQIYFNVSNIPINVINTITFTAYIGSTPITPDSWTSSNLSVGTIDLHTGFFTALSKGVTTITATSGNSSGSTTVTVT